MTDKDRDELANDLLDGIATAGNDTWSVDVAEHLLAAGWRKTVTPHTPEITSGTEGTWLVYCTACSEAEGDYVQVCRRPIRDGGVFGWPPVVLVPRSSRTVTPEQIDSASDAAAEAGESQHRKCHQGCCWPLGIHVATEAAARAFGLVSES